MNELRIHVPGTPVPQGSKKHVGGGRMVETSAGLQPWRDAITWHAKDVLGGMRWDTQAAYSARLLFTFARPKSHYQQDRKAGGVKRRITAPEHKTTRPDLDKLVRAALDALTAAGVWVDDSHVVQLVAQKAYTVPGNQGVTIHVEPIAQEVSE